ncbi:hypothetical protein WSM22_45900 [Cytophagales bacterium WSM2-2]|nr:hypothetical protein WSM22_45900 [Cytophagales bacterium WSM2-2]
MKAKILSAFVAIASIALLAGCANQNLDPSSLGKKLSTLSVSGKDLRLAKSLQLLVPVGTTNFAVLAGTTVTNDGLSVITGDLGVSPGTAITGFEPTPINAISGPGTVTAGLGIVNGTIYASGPVAAQAHNDAVIAYNYLVAQVADTTYAGVTQLNGLTFTPGVYKFAPSANLQVNGVVYLDFQGNNDALFIFQLGTTLVTMDGSNVIALNNDDQACSGSNVFWAVGSSATINGAQFIGSVIANTTITLTSASSVEGKIWALNGAVTMIDNTISACGNSTGGGTVPPPKPCGNFVTGGGCINGSHHDKITFGVSGGIKNNKFWGQLSFDDHKNRVKVKSVSVTAYIVIDAKTRQIEGLATINGHGSFTYKVIVVDNGQGCFNDSFNIELSNGYNASGRLRSGNIMIHNKCDGSKDKDKDNDDDHQNDKHDRDHH